MDDREIPLSPLVAKLWERQTRAGWSDRQMAESLGVSLSLWRKTRNRKLPVGMAILHAAVARFPDLAGDALALVLLREPDGRSKKKRPAS